MSSKTTAFVSNKILAAILGLSPRASWEDFSAMKKRFKKKRVTIFHVAQFYGLTLEETASLAPQYKEILTKKRP